MFRNKGLLVVMLLFVSVMLLSFGSMVSAEALTNEQQELWENKQLNESMQLRVMKNVRANELRQLRLQECEEPCDSVCVPKQSRLQKNEQLNEQRELRRQQRNELRKQLSEA